MRACCVSRLVMLGLSKQFAQLMSWLTWLSAALLSSWSGGSALAEASYVCQCAADQGIASCVQPDKLMLSRVDVVASPGEPALRRFHRDRTINAPRLGGQQRVGEPFLHAMCKHPRFKHRRGPRPCVGVSRQLCTSASCFVRLVPHTLLHGPRFLISSVDRCVALHVFQL